MLTLLLLSVHHVVKLETQEMLKWMFYERPPKVLSPSTSLEVDNTVMVEGSDMAASADGVSVSSTPPIISVTSPGDVPTMEEDIDVVTSTDPCINTDDSVDMQDGTSLCDSETTRAALGAVEPLGRHQ